MWPCLTPTHPPLRSYSSRPCTKRPKWMPTHLVGLSPWSWHPNGILTFSKVSRNCSLLGRPKADTGAKFSRAHRQSTITRYQRIFIRVTRHAKGLRTHSSAMEFTVTTVMSPFWFLIFLDLILASLGITVTIILYKFKIGFNLFCHYYLISKQYPMIRNPHYISTFQNFSTRRPW